MHKKFELFRLSLVAREQRDFILDGLDGNITKEEYIRKVFSCKYLIIHRGVELHYVFFEKSKNKKFLGGRIGRSFQNVEYTPPAQGLSEEIHKGWKALSIVIDPSHHTDGQKIAVEVNNDVGTSSSILFSLIEEINRRSDAIYAIDCHPIIDSKSFWSFAELHKGNITQLSFEFTAPNMFGGKDSIQQELRAFRDQEKAQKVGIRLSSPDGLNTNTERVRESVEYAEKGCGDIQARTKEGSVYNSKKRVKMTQVTIESDEFETMTEILKEATKILGE
ncbi:MAG: hypothetical protein SOH81_11610 [Acetobacter sp.]